MYKVFFEDVVVNARTRFGRYEMTKEEIIEFATRFDPQPFHLDDDFAKTTHFGALCASGWHTSAALMRMLVDHGKETGFASLGSPGLQDLKWAKPVYVGDILSVEQEFLDKRQSKSRPTLGLVTFNNHVYNHHNDLVMSVTGTMMVACRPKK
jgi:acyl dehydratase